MKVNKELFFELQKKINDIPYCQTKCWHDISFKSLEDNIVYFVNATDDPRICCYAFLGYKRFIGSVLYINGISRKSDVNITEFRTFFKSIVEVGYNVIRVSDVAPYSADFEVGIRRAGFVRPLGLRLCPMTLMVYFKEPFNFHRKWRNHVKNSRKIGNYFDVITAPTRDDAEDFVRMFSELKERKGLGYTCSTDEVYSLLKDNYRLFVCKNKDGRNVCGRLEYIYNNKACDIYAANTYEGLKTGAVYQLQEDMLEYMKEMGCVEFDYGRIPPSDDYMDDIYIAKSYSGGHAIGLNGEWIYGKSLLKQYISSFYMHYIRKNRIY